MPFKSKKARAEYQKQRRARVKAGIQNPAAKGLHERAPGGRPAKHSPEVLRAILDAMLKPYTGLEIVAKAYGLSVQAITLWQRLSAQDEKNSVVPSPWFISYLDQEPAYFHRWMAFVRAVAVSRIDARIIEAATSSHFEPQFNPQSGVPFWRIDAKVAADAKSMDQFDWDLEYGTRDRSDVYERDAEGRLIQVMKEVPPQPAILVKAAASLLSQTYGERVTHDVHLGGVIRVGPSSGPAPRQLAPAPTAQILDADFAPIGDDTEVTNVLVVGETATFEEFEETFGGKRLTEAILAYAEDGTLLPPTKGIVIVEGSSVHRAYIEARIEVDAQPAAVLVAQGYCNSFLTKLTTPEEVARAKQPEQYAPMPPPEPEPALRRHPRAYMADTGEKPPRPAPGGGERYARIDSGERTGYGVAPPGGVSVTRYPGRSITK